MPSGHPIPDDVRAMIVEMVADAMAQRARKYQLKELIRNCLANTQHADPSIATIERLCTDARALLRASIGLNRDEGRKTSIALYESIIACNASAPKDKIKAQERIDKVLGLEHHGSTEDNTESVASRIRESLKQLEDESC